MQVKYIKNPKPQFAEFNEFVEKHFPEFIEENDPELLLVCGGDGAMLWSIQNQRTLKVPFFGKAMGNLNFLMNKFANNQKILSQLKNDQIKLDIIETKLIKADITDEQGKIYETFEAVNEIVIGDSIMGYHQLIIDSADNSFNAFQTKCTGVCFSTALGSTAFNFNNGGTILPLGHNLWSVTGIVSNRYLNDIVPAQKFSIDILGREKLENEKLSKLSIFVDGIPHELELEGKFKVELNVGQVIKLAFLNKEDFNCKRVGIAHRFRKGEKDA